MLSDDVMEKLTEYYRRCVVGMNRRLITPYSTLPDVTTLESLEKSFLDAPSKAGCGGVAIPGGGRKGGIPRRRLRAKSSEGNVDIVKQSQQSPPSALNSILDTQEAVVKEAATVKDEKSPLSADKASDDFLPSGSSPAEDDPGKKFLVSSVDFVTPSKSSSNPLPLIYSAASLPENPSRSLRDIISEEMAKAQSTHVIDDQHTAANAHRWPKKISQKERKRQSLVTPEKTGTPASVVQSEASASSGSPWKFVEKVVSSFKDLMLTEEKVSVDQVLPLAAKQTGKPNQASAYSEPNQFSWGIKPSSSSPTLPLTPGSPVSEPGSPTEIPWHRSPRISESGRSDVAAATCFSDILRDEMVETQTLKRTARKSLHLIQIEEQAMSALLDFYKASDSVHEHISVERVASKNARPLWAATQRQSSHQF